MTGFLAFLRKEFLEQIRTYKALILLAVFLIFGMMGPPLAKMTPEILAAMPPEGMEMAVPQPTFLDAHAQFFKNLSQMGMIVVLLVFGGTLSQEISKGTLVNILSKGLPRSAVLLSKFLAALCLWSASFILAAAVNYGYTHMLFGEAAAPGLLFSLFCMWLFGAFVLALILMLSVLVNGHYGGLLASAATLFALMILNAFPRTAKFNPIALAARNFHLISGAAQPADLMPAALTAAGCIAVFLCAALAVLGKKAL